MDAADLYVSAITILELALPTFAQRTLAVDTAVARRCASLHVPDKRSERNALIAATALVHGMAVVTRNVADMQATGAQIINPWIRYSGAS